MAYKWINDGEWLKIMGYNINIEYKIDLIWILDEHRFKERELKTDNRYLSVSDKEQELSNLDYLYSMQLEADR